MKKFLASALVVLTVLASGAAIAGSPFSDVKPSHWAYDAIGKLAAKGYVEGYKDGTFKGDKTLTRYELAMVISRLIGKIGSGNSEDLRTLERLTVEFSDELALLGVKVAALEEEMKTVKGDIKDMGDFGKVKITGDMRVRFQRTVNDFDTRDDNNWANQLRIGLNFSMQVDENVSAYVRWMRDEIPFEISGVSDLVLDEAYVNIKNIFNLGDVRIGRQWMTLGHNFVLADKLDGIKFTKKIDRVDFTLFAFSTRTANSGVNDQHYGNAIGTKNFYMFSDKHTIVPKAGAGVLGAGVYGLNGAGLSNSANYAAFAANDKITLYSTQYPYPQPTDAYLGSKTGANPNFTWNQHAGLGLAQAGILCPTDIVLPTYSAFTDAVNNVTGAAGADGLSDLDSAGTVYNQAQALTRDWDIQSGSGLDSWGFNVAVDFGGHKLAGYYLTQKYDRYDPYTRLGDPWAAMVDQNNDMAIDLDANGRDLSPSADPSYWGITLDGNILKNLDYYFEYVTFDPDINNIGVDPLTGIAKATATTWKGNNLDNGNAWLLGIDWDIVKDLNLTIQYGVGDEEFVPVSIYESKPLLGMFGRFNDAFTGSTFNGSEGTTSFTGIKDLIFRLTRKFNAKSTGYVHYEIAKDNDSSAARLISGDPMVTGHAVQDYTFLELAFMHQYRPNTALKLTYVDKSFKEDKVEDAHAIGASEALYTDDVNAGSWSRIRLDVMTNF